MKPPNLPPTTVISIDWVDAEQAWFSRFARLFFDDGIPRTVLTKSCNQMHNRRFRCMLYVKFQEFKSCMESKGTIFRSKLSHVVHDFVVCGWSGRWQSGCALHSQLWQLPAMRKESADDMWGTPFWSCWCVKIPSLGDAPWESMRYRIHEFNFFLEAFF